MTRTRLGFALFGLRVSWPGWVNPLALAVGVLGVGLAMALVATDRR